jgi:hypothetical protein
MGPKEDRLNPLEPLLFEELPPFPFPPLLVTVIDWVAPPVAPEWLLTDTATEYWPAELRLQVQLDTLPGVRHPWGRLFQMKVNGPCPSETHAVTVNMEPSLTD